MQTNTRNERNRGTGWRLAAGSLATLALAAAAGAQNQIATSPSYTALTMTTRAGEARMTNATRKVLFRADWQHLGQKAVPASPGYRMLVNTLGPLSFSSVGPPLLTNVTVDRGPKAGGTGTTVQGLRLTDSNGAATVNVGGAPATVVVASSTSIDVVTGPGLNVHNNPLGPSDVVVTHANGTGARDDAFVYQPAIRNQSSGSIGAVLQLEYTSDLAGTFYQLWAGGIFPGVAIPIPPFAGKVEVWNPAFQLTQLLFASGQDAPVPIFIPNDATLIGAKLWFQGVSITQIVPSIQGTFTNALPVTFVP